MRATLAADMSDGPKSRAWRSPKAWLSSAAFLVVLWLGVYFFTGSTTAATTITVIVLLVGAAGVLYT